MRPELAGVAVGRLEGVVTKTSAVAGLLLDHTVLAVGFISDNYIIAFDQYEDFN